MKVLRWLLLSVSLISAVQAETVPEPIDDTYVQDHFEQAILYSKNLPDDGEGPPGIWHRITEGDYAASQR